MRLQANFQSIRSIVTTIIVVLGLLGLAATLITGHVYHSLTLRSQLENIEKQLELETNNTLQHLQQYSLQFSTLIISSGKFRDNITSNNKRLIFRYLAGLQQSPFLQNGALDIRNILLYDNNGKLLNGVEYKDKTVKAANKTICQQEMPDIKHAANAMDTDIIYDLCSDGKTPYLIAKASYVVDKQPGYMVFVSDITSSLFLLDQRITFPVRLRLKNHSVVFLSGNWPEQPSEETIASFPVKNKAGETVFYIDAIHQDPNLDKALSLAQILVISGAFMVIAIAVLLAFYILKQTVISPVNDVVSSLRMVRDNKDYLGAQVRSRGADEIMHLMDDFNAMSSALGQLYNTLEKMAYSDSLTRLGNRKLFHEKLQQVFSQASTQHRKFALFIIDLDKFKQVNDTYGHQVGDSLLIEISNRFSDVLRNIFPAANSDTNNIASMVQDHLARVGGDEFAVILPDISDKVEVAGVAEKLSAILDEPILLDGSQIDVGLSIGIALYPTDAMQIEQLIHRADEAMYQAKKAVKDYLFYADNITKQVGV